MSFSISDTGEDLSQNTENKSSITSAEPSGGILAESGGRNSGGNVGVTDNEVVVVVKFR